MFNQLVLLLSALLIGLAGYAQPFNFQPCYAYWRLTDQLRKGIKPTPQEWDQLKQMDGYKRVNQTGWDHFVEQVNLVYTPGNEAGIQQAIKIDRSLQRIVRYAREEENLKQYIAKMNQRQLMDSALVYTKRMLPKKWKNCFPTPRIDFILYNYDGSGRQYGVTMDLLLSYDLDPYRPGVFLGHELLHYALFYCRVKARHFKPVPQDQQAAFLAINGISEEGIADLIDKPFLLFEEQSPYREKAVFLDLYTTQSHLCIAKINQTFEQLADQSGAPYTSIAYWNSIVLASGHVPGMYMGRLIQQQGLTQALIQHIENPFQFFYLYQKAAQKAKNRHPTFSSKALGYLKAMERQHY